MTPAPSSPPRTRVVLLGASNLTRGISTAVETCRLMLGSPIEILAALGHGRSYGTDSTVLFRTLPGILHCGLWDALNQRTPHKDPASDYKDAASDESAALADEEDGGRKGSFHRDRPFSREPTGERSGPPTFALITDIGNDIMYGETPSTIIDWITQCIDRLAGHNARIAMSTIPIQSIRTLKPWKYRIVKSMLFPTRSLTFSQAIDRANELHDLLLDLARRRALTLIEPSPHWYGFDPIHIRMTHWPAAWRTILAQTFGFFEGHQSLARGSMIRWGRLRTARPRNMTLAGRQFGRPQPALRLKNGMAISLF